MITNIKPESIEKVINKSFGTLEDKVDNILKEFIPEEIKIGIYIIKRQQIEEMIKILHESSNKKIEYVSNLCVDPSKNLNIDIQSTCHGTECEAKITSICKDEFVLIGDYHTHVTEDGEDIPSILDLKEMYENKYPLECIGLSKNNTIKCYTRKDMEIKPALFFIRLWIDTLEAIIKLTELNKTRPENFLEDSNFEVRNILKKHFIETLIYSNPTKEKQLTGNDIFDITTTEMSYYDDNILSKYVVGNLNIRMSFRCNRRIMFKIELMSPEDYLKKSYDIHKYSYDFSMQGMSFDDYLKKNINMDLVENYKERVLEGSKMPIPVLDYDNMLQNGRHRAVVAQQLEVEEIPVLVVRSYEE